MSPVGLERVDHHEPWADGGQSAGECAPPAEIAAEQRRGVLCLMSSEPVAPSTSLVLPEGSFEVFGYRLAVSRSGLRVRRRVVRTRGIEPIAALFVVRPQDRGSNL